MPFSIKYAYQHENNAIQHHYLELDMASVPVEMYCDNARLVDSLKSGSIVGARSVRHLKLKIGWLREEICKPHVKFEHIAGVNNPADLFTKPFSEPEILKYSEKLNVY